MKKEATALQIEVNTEEDWKQFLSRSGLILADIYSEWSGPCLAMLSTLRQVKMDIGGDLINYAIIKNDEINDLERFRGSSEPVWMFLQDGKMVNIVFGAHCPRLKKILIDEIKRVQNEEDPKWSLSVDTRSPEEEARWQKEETVRRVNEENLRLKEEADKREKYEAFLEHMMIELCEETTLILYPWVFKDENGRPRDKHQSPPYTELVQDLLRQHFDVQEEHRLRLTEEIIEKLLIESGTNITKELIAGLTNGKCMTLRLKGRRPHSDWPVQYPYQNIDTSKKRPSRAINDIENYLTYLLSTKAPFTVDTPGVKVDTTPPYKDRHFLVHEPDPEIEDDFARVEPALWTPIQARNKVHAMKTLFSTYLDLVHPYEEPVPPPPYCAFKFKIIRLPELMEVCALYPEALEYIGVFESDKPPYTCRLASSLDDIEKKIKYKTGQEVIVLIIRRVSEEAFLSFASIEPDFVTEDDMEAEEMIEKYFPEGAVDKVMRDSLVDDYDEQEEDLGWQEESMEEEEIEEEEINADQIEAIF